MTDTFWPTTTTQGTHVRGANAPVCFGTSGSLSVRLATKTSDVIAAQRLRYTVFYEEMSAIPSDGVARSRLDHDPLDLICDHLLVIDESGPRERIVGTYRLLPHDVAEANGGFYSASEYDIPTLLERFPDKRFLEVGRSCVHQDFRKKRTIELLWQGLWNYIRQHRFDAMFGCASLPGIDPQRFADSIRLIAAEANTPAAWKVAALPGMGRPVSDFGSTVENPRRALKQLPPLVKAYMRLGAYFSDDMFIDRQFQTTDFLVILPVSQIRDRYFGRFGAPDALSGQAQALMS